MQEILQLWYGNSRETEAVMKHTGSADKQVDYYTSRTQKPYKKNKKKSLCFIGNRQNMWKFRTSLKETVQELKPKYNAIEKSLLSDFEEEITMTTPRTENRDDRKESSLEKTNARGLEQYGAPSPYRAPTSKWSKPI